MQPRETLRRVCGAIDALLEATDAVRSPLFPSILGLEKPWLLDERPAAISGQREHDRAWQGCNLMHDHVLLRLLYQLGPMVGRERYDGAANLYLLHFATQCCDTPSGLFLWGEHSYWDLSPDGRSVAASLKRGATHDHLRQAPAWLWERLWDYDSQVVTRFCDGLDWHWTTSPEGNYNRHADLSASSRMGHTARSCDFPRHSGFYLYDLCFVYARSGRTEYRQAIERLLDYWWDRRWPDNSLASESRSPKNDKQHHRTRQMHQTVSLALSLIEAADLVQPVASELAQTMRERGSAYFDGLLAQPHDANGKRFAMSVSQDSGQVLAWAQPWGGVYGRAIAAHLGWMVLRGAQLTQRDDLYRFAKDVGKMYLDPKLPTDQPIRALDASDALSLLCNLFDATSQPRWSKAAAALVDQIMPAFFDRTLPRAAVGCDWYENQLGTTYLLHSLARYATLMDPELRAVGADYTHR